MVNTNNHCFYIISTHDFYGNSAGSTRMSYYARALANNTDRVYLISCSSTPLDEDNFEETSPNVFVLKEKNICYSFSDTWSFLKRLNQFTLQRSGSKSFLLYPTVYMLFEILTILYLKVFKRLELYYELNEVRKFASSHEAPLSFTNITYSVEKILFKTVFTVTQPLLFFYSGLICISKKIEEYGRRFNKNTLRVPILTDPHQTIELSENCYHNKKAFNIGFSGSIDPIKEDLFNFNEVIDKLNENGRKVSFNLCGAIKKTFKAELNQKITISDTFNYYGFLNNKELATFLNQQNLLILPRGFTLQNDYGFSTKLSDYLNHKKMVLVTDISDNALFIKDGINGFIVPPDNKKAMYEKICYVMDNYELLEPKVSLMAAKTSKRDFNFHLYSEPLRNFLTNK